MLSLLSDDAAHFSEDRRKREKRWRIGGEINPLSLLLLLFFLRPWYTRQFFLQLATQRWRIKNLSSCRGGVTRLQLFSQLATRTITKKMACALSERKISSDWPILKKIALQVAEGMLNASNLSRNVAKSRGSFYFSCNSQCNNCSCKMECYTWIFSCNLQRNKRCVASCKKNCFV